MLPCSPSFILDQDCMLSENFAFSHVMLDLVANFCFFTRHAGSCRVGQEWTVEYLPAETQREVQRRTTTGPTRLQHAQADLFFARQEIPWYFLNVASQKRPRAGTPNLCTGENSVTIRSTTPNSLHAKILWNWKAKRKNMRRN